MYPLLASFIHNFVMNSIMVFNCFLNKYLRIFPYQSIRTLHNSVYWIFNGNKDRKCVCIIFGKNFRFFLAFHHVLIYLINSEYRVLANRIQYILANPNSPVPLRKEFFPISEFVRINEIALFLLRINNTNIHVIVKYG